MLWLLDSNTLIRLPHQVHDARIVAAMNVHGVTHPLTLNGADFRRFRSITVQHPHDI
jgi:hypothetical protein